MRLSVVIPAFNEERTIGRALDALAAEADAIDEVIVVDNNSTDGTAGIVAGKEASMPNLVMISEAEPGLVPARNAGIAAASEELVARIDADTFVEPGWGQAIREFFDHAEDDFAAALGPFEQHDMPLQWVHRMMVRMATGGDQSGGAGFHEAPALYGANMVIRASAWRSIEDDLHGGPDIAEDYDISLCLRQAGLKIALVEGMRARVSGRRMLSSRASFWKYTDLFPRTLELHGMHEEAREARKARWLHRFFYVLFWVPSRSFDPETRKHSVRHLLGEHEDRLIP